MEEKTVKGVVIHDSHGNVVDEAPIYPQGTEELVSQHNADPDAHPAIREAIVGLRTQVGRRLVGAKVKFSDGHTEDVELGLNDQGEVILLLPKETFGKIDGVKVNGEELPVDDNGKVDIPIPTTVHDLDPEDEYATKEDAQAMVDEAKVTGATLDYQEDGGAPSASVDFSEGSLGFTLRNMKMKFSDLEPEEKEELRGPQGIPGDNCIPLEGESPLAQELSQATDKAITPKAVEDAVTLTFDGKEVGTLENYAKGIDYATGAESSANANVHHFKIINDGYERLQYDVPETHSSYCATVALYNTTTISSTSFIGYVGRGGTGKSGTIDLTQYPNLALIVICVKNGYADQASLTLTKSVKKATSTLLKDTDEIKEDVKRYDNIIGTEDVLVNETTLTGTTTAGGTQSVSKNWKIEQGQRYAFEFSRKDWATSNLTAASNSFWLHAVTSTATSGGTALFTYKRPDEIPDSLRLEFVATTGYIYFSMRANVGEEVSFSLKRVTRLQEIEGKILELSALKNDVARMDNVIGEDDKLVCETTLIGNVTTSAYTAKTSERVGVVTGEKYAIEFSRKDWATSFLSSAANAFWLHSVANTSATEGIELYKVFRPSKIPDSLRVTFVAKTPYLYLAYRGNEGEEVTFTIKHITRLQGIEEQVEELSSAIGALTSTDIVDLNGGKKVLENKFKSLKKPTQTWSDDPGNVKPCNLLFFSDLHNQQASLTRILQFNAEFSSYIDDILHGGDSVNDRYDQTNPFAVVEGGEQVMNVIGNHDNWDYNNTESDTIGGRATPKKVYSKFIEPFCDNWGVTFPENAEENGYCYWYKDYTSSNLRLVALNCMTWYQNKTENVNDTEQAEWLTSVLADARIKGYAVVIIAHYRPYGEWTNERQCTFSSLYGYIDQWSRVHANAVQIVQDAIDNGLKFVCWLSGHEHHDLFGHLNGEYSSQYTLAVDKAAPGANGYGWERDAYRADNDRSRDAFNIISIDTKSQVLTVMRIGNNIDKFMRQKNYLTFDYVNHIIVGNS